VDNTLLHLRVGREGVKTLDDLTFGTFSRQQIAAMILEAALEAVRTNQMHLSFPPRFSVNTTPAADTDRIIRLNETAERAKKKG
jgi:hypothetical protein